MQHVPLSPGGGGKGLCFMVVISASDLSDWRMKYENQTAHMFLLFSGAQCFTGLEHLLTIMLGVFMVNLTLNSVLYLSSPRVKWSWITINGWLS